MLGLKFESILVICIIILSYFFLYWNSDSNANNLDNGMNSSSTLNSNRNLRAGNFNWGEIEVISEPISAQNNNINQSTRNVNYFSRFFITHETLNGFTG